MAETAYRIRRNEHYTGSDDSTIRKIEGIYRSLEHSEQVVKQASTLQIINLPDGKIRLYEKDVTRKEIEADTTGQSAVAVIELVQ